MKALVLIDNAILQYSDVPMPEKVTSDDVLVKLDSAGSGSREVPPYPDLTCRDGQWLSV